MENTDDDKINQLIRNFENLEKINAGSEFEKQLMKRITAAGSRPVYNHGKTRLTVFVFAFVLLNSYLIFRAGNENTRTEQRTEILNTVSEQLLINSSTRE